MVAVGTTIADRPPHRAVRAALPHKRMPLCNGADIGCVSHIDNITGRESGLTSLYGASRERTYQDLTA